MARKTSVVARCAVFCNGFAPLFDERVKKVRCKKSGSARRAVFCNGFEPFATAAGPTCVRLASGLNRLALNGKLEGRVAGVRFVPKTKVLYESGNVF